MQTGIRIQQASQYATTPSKALRLRSGQALRGPMLGIILLVWNLGAAEPSNPVALPRLTGPIVLDGLSDEPAWEAVAPLPMTMLLPTFGGVPSEKTEIRIAYDDDYLYAAGRFYVTDPADIRGNALVRDGGSISDDGFILLLDTFNDNETALIFVTTPAGIREDMTMANDAQRFRGAFPGNKSWNTFWDVAVERNGEGWFAEMRIPFSSLRFQDEDGRITMGLIATRRIAYKNEVVTYPAIDPKWDLGLFKPSIAQDVILEGVRSQKPLYITPYVLGGINQTYGLEQYPTVVPGQATTRALGLDVKYSLTSNLTVDLTVNTDFAQVEVDDEQINLTRFNLFFPEKRLFFQERASVFNLSTGGRSGLFYSRRIGLSEHGPVPILGGIRLVGRVGAWDLGVINMQTAKTTFKVEPDSLEVIPAENFGVLRLRRQILNPYSYTGAMLTSRVGADGSSDYAYGFDTSLRLFGDDYLSFLWAHDINSETRPLFKIDSLNYSLLDAGRLRLHWERRSNQGLGYRTTYSRRGALYDPGVGLERRDDYTYFGPNLSYTWMPGESSPVYLLTVRYGARTFFRNADLKEGRYRFETLLHGPELVYTSKGGSFGRLTLNYNYEDLPEKYELPDDLAIPAGQYTFYDLKGTYQTASTRLLRAMFIFSAGSFYDGWLVSLSATPTWIATRFLTVTAGYTLNRAEFPGRNEGFAVHLAQLRISATLNTSLSALAFIQLNSAEDAIGINMRIRYNPREGTDLYLVYNEGFNTDRRRELPILPLTDSRTVLLKYSTTFIR